MVGGRSSTRTRTRAFISCMSKRWPDTVCSHAWRSSPFPRVHDLASPFDEGQPLTWGFDNVDLVTVGVDIGSSTSHLLFAHLHLQRLAQSLSSRFAVVSREVLHRSPILLTPYRPDGLIDVDALDRFIQDAYREAGLEPDQ